MAYIHEHAEKSQKKCAMCALDNDTRLSFCLSCIKKMGRDK